MIINLHSQLLQENGPRQRVFLDDKEVLLAWYADTELGIVKTYNVEGDGHIYQAYQMYKAGVEEVNGIASITLRGVVRLEPVPLPPVIPGHEQPPQ